MKIETARGDEIVIPDTILEREGWVEEDRYECPHEHCDSEECSCGPFAADVVAVIRAWHNETHRGVLRFCDERPCADLRPTFVD